MSKCISRHGEYSEHRPDREGYCELCGDLDMEAHDRAAKADALREAADDLGRRAERIRNAEHKFGFELAASVVRDRIEEEA